MNSTATKPVYPTLSSLVSARLNCIKAGNSAWESNHTDRIEQIVKDSLPSGCGIDSGVSIDLDVSKPDRLVFRFGFHHMNDAGYYDGWTEHRAIVTPSLAFGFDLRITGRDRNQIKDYLHDTFHHALSQDIQE